MNYKFTIFINCKGCTEEGIIKTIESVKNQTALLDSKIQVFIYNNIEWINKESDQITIINFNEDNIDQLIEGEIVSYLQAGARYESNTLEEIRKFFESKNDYVSVIATPMKYNSNPSRQHELNYKFKVDKLTNLYLDYNFKSLSLRDVFIKSNQLNNKSIREYVKLIEQPFGLDEILMKEMRLGVVSTTTQWLEEETIGERVKFSDVLNYLVEIVNKYTINRRYLPNLAQIRICNYLNEWLLECEDFALLRDSKILKDILQQIEDIHIISTSQVVELKLLLLGIKYNKDVYNELQISNLANRTRLYYKDNIVLDIEQSKMKINKVLYKDSHLELIAEMKNKGIRARGTKFSIVMAIYNTEKYLEEAIESIVGQDIGFKENIQLILINDGSTDNSGDICGKYVELYPDNIVYYKQENQGVSAARNVGVRLAEGKYINFLDPDDKLDIDVLSKVWKFFEENEDELDVIAIPMQFFEAQEGSHPLNYKFKTKRVIDLRREYNAIQLSSSSAFCRTELVKEIEFDERLMYLEDALLINKVLSNTMKLGVLSDVNYWYRRRFEGSSASQSTQKGREWYIDTIEYFYFPLITYYKNKLGYLPRFIQYLLIYNLNWKISVDSLKSVLEKDDIIKFKQYLKEILKEIEQEVIISSKNSKVWYKEFALKLKDEEDFLKNTHFLGDENRVYFNYKDLTIWDSKQVVVAVQGLNFSKDNLLIEGYIDIPLKANQYKLSLVLGDREYDLKEFRREDKDILIHDKKVFERRGFKEKIIVENLNKEVDLKIKVILDNIDFYPKIWIDDNMLNFNSYMNYIYSVKGEYIFVYLNNRIVLMKKSLKRVIGREIRFFESLYKQKKYKEAFIRLIISTLKVLYNKEIWLFMDRIDKADDNAEVMFKYACKQKDGIKKYFVVDKESEDFKRLKKVGRVVAYNSIKHKLLLILSRKVISSHAADFSRNHFKGNGAFLKSLQDFKFIFLQHGITQNDVSKGLGKYNKNISLLVSAAEPEYKEFISGKYFYDENIVKLTGFPRFDNLYNEDKKQILVMPTWREYLMNKIDFSKKDRVYREYFVESEYYKKYNDLINDKRVLECAKKYGYKLVFFIHPELRVQLKDFKVHNQVIIPPYYESYQKMFRESSLMITDYSSVAFDFAYTKKPIIYFQFDREEFFGRHYKPGYFDYYKNGFGEVCENYEELVQLLINYMMDDCKLKTIYDKRINEFYKYTDQNNSKRVYEAIRKLQ